MAEGIGSYDIVVLGGGSGGYACALRAAELGKRVALIEKDKVGGTCLHRGCIPTKALLHAAEIADHARDSASVGVKTTFEGIDVPGVLSYKDGVVERLWKGLQSTIASRKIDTIEGSGRLESPHSVRVGDTIYEAEHIVLASGSQPRSLPGLEIDGERVITSDHALVLDRVPASVVILGGGVIGVEFASVWKSFGADVTILEALPRLVAAEDEEISKTVERAFRKRKITFLTGTPFQSVKTTDTGVAVTVEGGDVIEAELLLVAVGRGPTTEGLGIDEAGIPRVTYSHPEVASVGLTEAQAREKYGEVEAVTYDLGGNGKSQILQTQGFVKLVGLVDGPVLGVHMVGDRVGELIGEAQLIYGWEAHADDVAPLVHAHPTQNEALGEAHLALAGKALHAHS